MLQLPEGETETLRFLTMAEAAALCGVSDLSSFFSDVEWQYPDPLPSYFVPKDSGAKVGLARILANSFLDRGPVLLWITGIGIWQSAEHMDLCTRYRLSYGESRPVIKAPVHLFSESDREALISVLCLILFFSWDSELITQDRSLGATISHDEWIEYRFSRGQEDIVPYFNKHLGWLSKR